MRPPFRDYSAKRVRYSCISGWEGGSRGKTDDTGADNVFPLAIESSFDDAQRTVKELFGDLSFRAPLSRRLIRLT